MIECLGEAVLDCEFLEQLDACDVCTDPGDEFLGFERLGEVVVSSVLSPAILSSSSARVRYEDHRRESEGSIRSYLGTQIVSAHVRKVDVENEKVGLLGTQSFECLGTGDEGCDFVASLDQ